MILILTGILGFVVFYYIREIFLRSQKVPPGPWPIPVFGNLHQIALAHSRPDLAFAKLSSKYGEIYRTCIGSNETVILASYEAIRSVLTHKSALARDMRGSFYDRNQGIHSGIIFSNGPKWETIRAWTIKNLKDYGFNKSSLMEASISADIDEMFDDIDKVIQKDKQGVIDVGEFLLVPVLKFTWKLLVGHCTTEDEQNMTILIDKTQKMANSGIFGAGLVNAFPFLRHVFPNWTGHNIMIDVYNESYRVAQDLLKEVRTRSIDTPDTFIEAYAKKLDDVGSNHPELAEWFNEFEFGILFLDLIQTGSETTVSYLHSLFLFIVLYPKVQEKMYEEITRCVPDARSLQSADSKSMIYTQAVMLEVHRHAKIIQNFVPRRVTEDFKYKEFVLKKGTEILTDLHTVYNSDIWDNPEEFRPERFIGKNGELINKEHVIPFSVGKRSCPAEGLGDVSAFLFFASTVRKYKLSVVPGEPRPRQDMRVAFTSKPFPYKVSFSARH